MHKSLLENVLCGKCGTPNENTHPGSSQNIVLLIKFIFQILLHFGNTFSLLNR